MSARVTVSVTPDGSREVVRFVIPPPEPGSFAKVTLPPVRVVELSADSRRLVLAALGLGDTAALLVGDLAEEYGGLPKGSACATFSGSEGVVLHVIGKQLTPPVIELGTGEPPRFQTLTIDTAAVDRERAALLEAHAADTADLRKRVAELEAELAGTRERAQVKETQLNAAVVERDELRAMLEEKTSPVDRERAALLEAHAADTADLRKRVAELEAELAGTRERAQVKETQLNAAVVERDELRAMLEEKTSPAEVIPPNDA